MSESEPGSLGLFKDLGKDIKDLLERPYFQGQKLRVQTVNSSGIEWSSMGHMTARGVHGTIEASLRRPSGVSFEKLRLKTDGRVLAEASYRLTAPMKFTVSVEDGRQEPGKPLHSFGRIGAQYTTPSLAVDADVDVVNGPTIRTSALLRKYSVLLGFDLQYNTHFEDKSMTPEVLDVNIGLGYEGRGWHFAAKTMEMLSSLRVGYFHKVNQDVTAGFMVDYRLRTNYQKIVLGAKWRLDEKTKLKARIDSNAMLSTAMRQKLSDHIYVNLSSEVNIQDFTADSHRFGLQLQFK